MGYLTEEAIRAFKAEGFKKMLILLTKIAIKLHPSMI